MDPRELEVLYEDNHLLVVNKPPGLPTMGTPADRLTLLALAKEYLKRRYAKPGNVYLGVMSRLDAPVTGALLLARTSKAAARLTEQFRAHAVEKLYWALVEGRVEPPEGTWTDWLVHDDRHRHVRVARGDAPGAREAVLHYRVRRVWSARSWLEIRLQTGRKHQIRVQTARRGHPVLGDRKYGSRTAFGPGIALHARRLVVVHPTLGRPVEVESPLPDAWRAAGVELSE